MQIQKITLQPLLVFHLIVLKRC